MRASLVRRCQAINLNLDADRTRQDLVAGTTCLMQGPLSLGWGVWLARLGMDIDYALFSFWNECYKLAAPNSKSKSAREDQETHE